VQIKAIHTVAGLRSRHIPAVLVDLDFIPHAWLSGCSAIRCSNIYRANVHLCTVVALVDVLVGIWQPRRKCRPPCWCGSWRVGTGMGYRAPPNGCQRQTHPCTSSSQTTIVMWAVSQVNKHKHGSIVVHVVNPNAWSYY
jgi:hypothetical protein